MSKADKSLDVVGRAIKLFNSPRVFKGCFNAYVLSSPEFRALVKMSSAGSIWNCWTVLFAVQKDCTRVNFVV